MKGTKKKINGSAVGRALHLFRGALLADESKLVLGVGARKDGAAADEFGQDAAHAPHVQGLSVGPPPHNHLGRAVPNKCKLCRRTEPKCAAAHSLKEGNGKMAAKSWKQGWVTSDRKSVV